MPRLEEAVARLAHDAGVVPGMDYDPGRERRAEQRARALLRSCVNDEEWDMYRELGFLRVWGKRQRSGPPASHRPRAPYAYLIYPHKRSSPTCRRRRRCSTSTASSSPTRRVPTERAPARLRRRARQWMALTGDEERIVASANMHLPGRQVDPNQVRRDLWRLSRWERERLQREQRRAGGVNAS